MYFLICKLLLGGIHTWTLYCIS